VDVKAIGRPGKFPPGATKLHLSEEPVATPEFLELAVIFHLSTFPAELAIVNNVEPDLLKELGSRSFNIIENHFVAFHP
jgi:hypothetical protein